MSIFCPESCGYIFDPFLRRGLIVAFTPKPWNADLRMASPSLPHSAAWGSNLLDEYGSPLRLSSDGSLVKIWNFKELDDALNAIEDDLEFDSTTCEDSGEHRHPDSLSSIWSPDSLNSKASVVSPHPKSLTAEVSTMLSTSKVLKKPMLVTTAPTAVLTDTICLVSATVNDHSHIARASDNSHADPVHVELWS